MSRLIDLRGQVFGSLVVLERGEPYRIEYYHKDGTLKKCVMTTWVCYCDPALGGCGNTKTIIGRNLKSGDTRSCGCFRKRGGYKYNKHKEA